MGLGESVQDAELRSVFSISTYSICLLYLVLSAADWTLHWHGFRIRVLETFLGINAILIDCIDAMHEDSSNTMNIPGARS